MSGYGLPVSIDIRTPLEVLEAGMIPVDIVGKPATIEAQSNLLACLSNSNNEFACPAIWCRREQQ